MVAVLRDEPDAALMVAAMDADGRRLMSVSSVLEVVMVTEGRTGSTPDMDAFLRRAKIEIVAFDAEQLGLARDAFHRYGKGRHKAGLNFGDCIAYALSQWSGEPLLYQGNDFAWTDVQSVL